MPSPAPDPELADLGRRLAEIAVEAAAVIRPYWRSGLEVVRKADASPVTEADRRGEAVIIERLKREFPGVLVVGEEDCAECGTPEEAPERFFLVDPLDGTRGFVTGSDQFTVNIALIEQGAAVAGAVATPADDRVWFTRTGGAVLREGGAERPIRVRARPEVAEAVLSRSVTPAQAQSLAARYGFGPWRAVDSSLKLCLIAEGRADLYPRTGPTSEWDIAAGQAVLEAAGGTVQTLDGKSLRYGKASDQFLNPPFVARGGPAARDATPKHG